MFNLQKGVSSKFYLGLVLVALSLILGKITFTYLIVEYLQDPFRPWSWFLTNRWLWFYILTWPIIVLGIWWVGKEYYLMIKKYVGYQFYHESLKEGTKKVFHKTKELQSRVREKWKREDSDSSASPQEKRK